MRLHRSSILIAALSLTLAASPAFADNLLTNGGFETGDFTGWTPSTTNFLLVAPADTANGTEATATENGYYAFDGIYAAQLGTVGLESLSQQFPVITGDQYTLSFWLNGDGAHDSNNILTTTFGEATPPLILINSTAFWTQELMGFTATTTGFETLNFLFDDQFGNFLSLDDVDVEDATADARVGLNGAQTTPEPSSLLLLGTGICGLAAIARRKLLNS